MMIYGKNGSGKSSIVDAWEWLYSGRIDHLAHEGAKERAFPHKEAKNGQTWIEVEFTNRAIGKIRAEFDPGRITRPKIEGNLPKMKEIIPHSCHLRYRDITEFVYEGKAKKYEKLSSQMGFGKAIDIQNQLQTGSRLVQEKLDDFKKERDKYGKEYREASGEEPKDVASFIKTLNGVFNRQGIATVKEIAEVRTSLERLRDQVEKDERAKKLQLWKSIQEIINQFYPVDDIRSNISKFQEDFTDFKQDEEELSKLVLLDLYEKGKKAIESLKIYDRCPLCDQPYEGDLIEHILGKQSHLDKLSTRRTELEKSRKELFSSLDAIIRKIEHASSYLEGKELEPPLIEFEKNLKNVNSPLKECTDILEKKIENIDKGFDFLTKVDTKEYKSILDSESKIKEEISGRVENLEKDESRKALVVDFQQANKLQESFLKWSRLNKKIERLEEIKSAYEKIREDYVEDTKKSVQESFDAISSDVKAYFEILEQDSDVLGVPKIKLYSEKGKAVELEVMFGGDPISPAYKFLSESQLNSFGLSIFLASAKHFNSNFKFIILDDVINSFDTYKRPRVIELLLQDKPTEAGWMFGRYLEWILQELCENLEASVKYSRRNEFTLSDLVQAFRVRMQKNLKSDHSIVKLILDFESDTGFRNFCDHWKDSETEYSSPEIRDIVQNWKDIESKIECDRCHKFIKYEKVEGYEHISCPCRKLDLKEDKIIITDENKTVQ
jgi:DNA repair exonuclease SbcCD ATPase subunit